MKIPADELKSRYDKLPGDVKSALFSTEIGDNLQKIGLKYNLHLDKISVLAETVGLVMLGVIKPQDFSESISKEMEIGLDIADQITSDLNTDIFEPIRKSLHNIHNEEKVGKSTKSLSTETPDFFEKKMSHLFTSTADLRAERAEVEDYTPPVNIGTSEDKASLADNIPIPPEKKRPEGLDPYRELPL